MNEIIQYYIGMFFFIYGMCYFIAGLKNCLAGGPGMFEIIGMLWRCEVKKNVK